MSAIKHECSKRFKDRSCEIDIFPYQKGDVTYSTVSAINARAKLCEMIKPKKLKKWCHFPRKYFRTPYTSTCRRLRETWQPECYERANGTYGIFEPSHTNETYEEMFQSELDCEIEISNLISGMTDDEK